MECENVFSLQDYVSLLCKDGERRDKNTEIKDLTNNDKISNKSVFGFTIW